MNSKKNVFVIMPFSSTETCNEHEWSDIYKDVFKPAIENCEYSCERAVPTTGSLIKSIVEKLKYSYIVLADLTDKNPNVFYELGVRHSLSKRTIMVAQGVEHIPSDLKGYWLIIYGTKPAEVNEFKREIKRLISEIEKNPDKSSNPISDYLEQEEVAEGELEEIHIEILKEFGKSDKGEIAFKKLVDIFNISTTQMLYYLNALQERNYVVFINYYYDIYALTPKGLKHLFKENGS